MKTYLLTYLLTHSVEQSPSWEANRFLASQEIPHILWNQKVHYRIHNCPPPLPILSQLDPFQTPTSHFLKINVIVLPYAHGLPSCLFPSGFPTKTLYTPHLSPHTRYIPRPSHSSRFYRPNNTINEDCSVELTGSLINGFGMSLCASETLQTGVVCLCY